MASDHYSDDEWPEDAPDKGSDNESPVSLPPPFTPNSNAPPRSFQVTRSLGSRHYEIKEAGDSKKILYYVAVSNFSLGTPDVTLHAGATEKSPVVGVCHLAKFASQFEVGLGDPKENPASVQWSSITRKSFLSTTYLWTLTFHGAAQGGREQTKNLAWVREGFGLRGLRLQDADSGEVLASYKRDKGIMNSIVEIHDHNLGLDFDNLVFLTALSIHVKTKRRKAGGWAAASGASG